QFAQRRRAERGTDRRVPGEPQASETGRVTTPIQRYRALLAARKLKPDAAQAHAATRLGHLYHALQHYRPPSRRLMQFLRRRSEAPKGLYIHGDVGRGKSAAMDLFFDSVQSVRKPRVHFN